MREVLDWIVSAWNSLPSIVVALLLLPLGWFAARVARFLVTKLLTLAGLEKLAKKTGAAEFLRKGGVEYSLSRLGGVIVYWFVIIWFLVRIAIELDVRLVASLYEQVVGVFPSALAGVLVVAIGAVLVGFTANFATTIARNAASRHAAAIGRGIKYVGNSIVVLIALEQVGLEGSILTTLLVILFGAGAFGAALAFGLGCKDMARDSAARFLKELKERDRLGRGTDLEG